MIWLVLALVGLLALLALRGGMGARLRRRQGLAGLALRWQMRFYASDRQDLLERFDQTHLFHLGHACRAYNIIQGRRGGYQIWAFDYAYEVGTRQNRSLERRQVVACRLKKGGPRLLAHRDGLFQGLGRFRNFGVQGIRGHEQAGRYTLRSDRAAGAGLLDRPCLALLGNPPAADAEVNGEYVLLYSERTLGAGQVMRLVNRAVRCAREMDLWTQASSCICGEQASLGVAGASASSKA